MLRILRRLTSLELPDDEFAETEFQTRDGAPDLRPSVYACPNQQGTQMHAEHAVSFVHPPVEFNHLDARAAIGGSMLVQSTGATLFAFTQAVHHEVMLADAAELGAFASAIKQAHCTTVPDCCIARYIEGKTQSADPEWVSITSARWRKFVRRSAPQCQHTVGFSAGPPRVTP